MSRASDQAELRRKRVLAEHIRATAGPFNPETLSKSYGLPIEEVRGIIKRNGG